MFCWPVLTSRTYFLSVSSLDSTHSPPPLSNHYLLYLRLFAIRFLVCVASSLHVDQLTTNDRLACTVKVCVVIEEELAYCLRLAVVA
jgi:hypothetical protein